jgi:predicted Rdx family selenoprotein
LFGQTIPARDRAAWMAQELLTTFDQEISAWTPRWSGRENGA